jgi:hypothetical protein
LAVAALGVVVLAVAVLAVVALGAAVLAVVALAVTASAGAALAALTAAPGAAVSGVPDWAVLVALMVFLLVALADDRTWKRARIAPARGRLAPTAAIRRPKGAGADRTRQRQGRP